MDSILHGFIDFFGKLLKIPLFITGLFFLCLGVSISIYALADFISGKRIKKSKEIVHVPQKNVSLFRKIFLDFPRQFITDLEERDPAFFPYQGCVIFCGRQGSGKTISMVEYIMRMQKEYPKSKVITNLAYVHEDDILNDWKPLITYKNGIFGVICAIDELQNWFSSNQSKDFPPEMLQVITQNRKNRRILLGTSQVFTRLAKPLREQATEVRDCRTFFGCITFVSRKEPILSCDGDVSEYKHKGWYCFVHNKAIRDAYDTYKVIDSLAESGFKERGETIQNINVSQFTITKKKAK